MNKLYLLPCVFIVLLCSCKLTDNNKTVEKPQLIESQTTTQKPAKSFTENTLLDLMTGEFAERRGAFEVALKNYITQANQTKDPNVVERAYQITYYLNKNPEQLDMALLWVSVAPQNIDANRAAAIQLIKNRRSNQATGYAENVLTDTKQLDFLNIANISLTKKTRQEIISCLNNLLVKHPNNAQLSYSKAILLAETGAIEEALSTLKQLPNGQQQQSTVLLLKVYLLQNMGKPDEALNLLAQAVTLYSKDKQLQLSYAHQLLSQGKIEEAKQQFINLMEKYPEDQELGFGYALICMENKEWDEAIHYLNKYIANGISSDAIYFYLATAYNEKGDKASALQNYQLITGGENYLASVTNSAKILFEKGQTIQAQQLLTSTRKKQPDFIIPLYLFEIEELLSIQQTSQAWYLISGALKQQPNNPYLLYSRALVAEKRNDLTQAEKDLRHIICLEPKNSAAINALGYILADRTTRYKEALQLIQQALKIDPSSPAILDSLGWVNYRLGNLAEATKHLQHAYESSPDPEIAAHLGEVLWQQGKQQQAKNVWSDALQKSPTNQMLQQTIFRLTGIKDL